jgi:hypothetical protein
MPDRPHHHRVGPFHQPTGFESQEGHRTAQPLMDEPVFEFDARHRQGWVASGPAEWCQLDRLADDRSLDRGEALGENVPTGSAASQADTVPAVEHP